MRVLRSRFLRPVSGLLFGMVWMLVALVPAARGATEDADALRAVLEGMLDERAAAVEAGGGAMLRSGDLKITPAAGGHAVTLPKLEFRGKDGGRTVLGVVTMTARPAAGRHGWDVEVRLPRQLQTFDAKGKPDTDISIGTQSLSGLLDADLRQFSAVTGAIGTVVMKDRNGAGEGRWDALRFSWDLKPDDAGLWSGPGQLVLDGLRFTNRKEGSSLALGSVTVETNCLQCNEAAARSIAAAGFESGRGANGGAGTSVLGPGFGRSLGDVLRRCRSSSANYALRDLRVTGTDTKNSNRPFHFGLAGASFGGDVVTDRADSLLSGTVRAQMTGLSGVAEMDTSGSPLMREFFPTESRFELAYRRVNPALWGMGRADSASADSSALARIGGLKAEYLVPGSILELKEFSFDAAALDARMSGILTGDADVPLGLLLDLTLTLTELDESLNRLRTMAANPGLHGVREKDLGTGIQALTFLQLFGRQGTAPDGRSQRSYHLVIDEQGQILLNGTDLKSLMQMVGSGKDEGE